MRILGISPYHGDSSAAMLEDGRIVAAAEEERFTRVKHWAGLPERAIEFCLRRAGAGIEEVDFIAVNRDPRAQLLRRALFALGRAAPWSVLRDRLHSRRMLLAIDAALAEAFAADRRRLAARLRPVEHHLAHAASAYLLSPFEDAAIITLDGFGDFCSTMLAAGRGGRVRPLRRVFFPHSLGAAYTAVTQFLGFPDYGDEYKVMGLSAYGGPAYPGEFRRLIRDAPDGTFRLGLRYFAHARGGVEMRWQGGAPWLGELFSPAMELLLGPRRREGEPLTQRHMDLAASLQGRYEEVCFALLRLLAGLTGGRDLCLAGGCGMNSVANGKVLSASAFRRVHIPAAPGDAGGAVGAAAHVHAAVTGRRPVPAEGGAGAYLGPEFGHADIRRAVASALAGTNGEVAVETVAGEEDLCRRVAADIAAGKVVGWFQGRMEWGPRALGNRSILADPRRAEMRDILNRKIKAREPFRPFAPSVLAERAGEYFATDRAVPFMSMVLPVRAEKRAGIPAVTHVDGTGRPQTVDRADNPRYWRLIHAFGEITGVPLVLNTSFNENEPIVCSPGEAIECFLRTGLDVLVLGDCVLRRREPA